MSQLFKIRDIRTGLFSTGGTKPKWNKSGKVWAQGPLLNHLAQFCKVNYGEWGLSKTKVELMIPINWEVVEIKHVEWARHNAKMFFTDLSKSYQQKVKRYGTK